MILTLRPIRLSSTRLARSLMTLPSSTMLCSISESRISARRPDRRERPDVGVHDARAGADDDRSADDRALDDGAGLDDHLALDARLGVDACRRSRRSIVSRISRLASSMSSSLPVSFHQPCDQVRPDLEAAVDQVLDRVGDLELVAEARLDPLHRLEDRRREHVDADQREVALRLLRLLDQADDAAVLRARRRRTSADRARGSAGSAPPAPRARTPRRTR